MWQVNFHRITFLTERGVVLKNENDNKLIFIQDLTNVMQFEIDHSFREFEAHSHYNVTPELVY
jgi:hypothetical protein